MISELVFKWLSLMILSPMGNILPGVVSDACYEQCPHYPESYDKAADACYNGCEIQYSDSTVVGSIDGESSWYYCFNTWDAYGDLTNYEIRVVGAYESKDAPASNNPGPITVNLQSCHGGDSYDFSKPTLLYLTSYDPVNWIITTSDSIVQNNINLAQVFVDSYYADNSSVSVSGNLNMNNSEITITRLGGYGYGNDCGGGNTQGMLEAMNSTFGDDVYSFIGAYDYSNLYICVGKQNGNTTSPPVTTSTETESTIMATSHTGNTGNDDIIRTTPSATSDACYEPCPNYPSGYDKAANGCYRGCQIQYTDSTLVGSIDDESSWYYCLNNWDEYSDLTNYEIRVVGAYESTDGHSGFRIHNPGPITVNLQSCHSGNDYDFSKPTLLYLASYEPVDWTITTSDSTVENNINLAQIYVASYYADNSSVSVSGNLNVDDSDITINYSSLRGYGRDCGGGNTQGMLEGMNSMFGDDVYSFIGAYEFDNVYMCVGKQNDNTTLVAVPTPTTSTQTESTITVTRSETDMTTASATSDVCYEQCPYYPSWYDQAADACYHGCQIKYNDSTLVGSIDDESNWYYCLNNWDAYDDLTNYEIRVVGAYESTDGHDGAGIHNPGPITVNLQSCHSGNDYDFSQPTLLYLTSYEPVNWIITTSDSTVENNVNLAQVFVDSYYADNSSVLVSDNLNVDDSDITITRVGGYGYGNDCGGGNTQGMLEAMNSTFGDDVYSFIGAYEFDTVYLCVGKQDNGVEPIGTGDSDTGDSDTDNSDSDTGKNVVTMWQRIAIFCVTLPILVGNL